MITSVYYGSKQDHSAVTGVQKEAEAASDVMGDQAMSLASAYAAFR